MTKASIVFKMGRGREERVGCKGLTGLSVWGINEVYRRNKDSEKDSRTINQVDTFGRLLNFSVVSSVCYFC